MRRFLTILLTVMCACAVCLGQTNKRIRDLESRRSTLQKQLRENETLLQSTRRDVASQLGDLNALTGQIGEQRRYIETIGSDLQALDTELVALNRQMATLQQSLADKKKKYETSVRHLYMNRSIQQRLMFIFSADNLAQTMRRLLYVRQYADFQRLQGLEIKRKQEQLSQTRTELQEVRVEKNKLMAQREAEALKLEQREKEHRRLVTDLRSKQRGLQNEIAKQRREANRLNDEIEKQIAIEIENARKRAEAEARREREAQARAQRNAQATQQRNRQQTQQRTTSTAPTSSTAASTGKQTASASAENYTLSKADRQLSTDFASNRGKLPMPITGPYIITGRYGQYAVGGLRNVTLDNKGINIQGKPGAQARAVFGGKVAAVFKLNGLFNILVRHGAYITVYCNLQNTAVKQGDDVATKQVLGTIFSDSSDGGRTTLHFQLRREKDKLNPEVWLNK